MLIGIRAMHRFATFLKITALASVTAVAATTVTAQDFTVYVYETGYFPNVVYSAEATRIEFVNETSRGVGIDTTSGSILINRIDVGSSDHFDVSEIRGRTIRTPYYFNAGSTSSGQYNSNGKTFRVISGSAPDS